MSKLTTAMLRAIELTDDQKRDFDIQLPRFLDAAQKIIDDYRSKNFPTLPRPVLSVDTGSKYLRIVVAEYVNGVCNHRSSYCFVDTTNGNILKASGWKAPEKKNPRGNIFEDDFGAHGLTPYGVVALR